MPKDIQAPEQDQQTLTEEVHTSESEIDWKAQARKWEKREKLEQFMMFVACLLHMVLVCCSA